MSKLGQTLKLVKEGTQMQYNPELVQKTEDELDPPFLEPETEDGRAFKHLTKELASKGAKNPKALAAWIGRKKMGKTAFQDKAAAGK